ncbi:hypothetical protein ACUY2E_00935 [Corynebacterium confusum]
MTAKGSFLPEQLNLAELNPVQGAPEQLNPAQEASDAMESSLMEQVKETLAQKKRRPPYGERPAS